MLANNANWVSCELKELIEGFQAGFACGKKDTPNGLKHLRMNNVGVDGNLNFELIRSVPHEQAKDHHYLQKDDVLFCSTNSAKLVGKSVLFNIDGEYAFSNHLTRLRPDKRIVFPVFLQLYLWLLWKKGHFGRHCKHWVNQSTLPKEKLLSTEICLPPIQEQRRIVAKLEKLMVKVDQCKARLEKIPFILKRFRQSVLKAAFTGELTSSCRNSGLTENTFDKFKNNSLQFIEWPSNWGIVNFGELICNGPKNGLYKPQSSYGSGISIVRIENFYDGEIEPWINLKKLSLSKKEQEYFSLQEEDILINRVNSMPFLGKSALVRNLRGKCVFESNMMRIRINKRKISSEYLIRYLNSSFGLKELRKNAKHAVNQSSINQQDVKETTVVLPPIEEQHEIVRRVESLFKIADQIEERYNRAKDYVDKLTKSILVKTFRGELVLQDPNDPPASELLERIKTAKEKAGSNKKNRKKSSKPKRTASKITQIKKGKTA